MRIAIITQPLRTNYGGILQNYALHVILKRRGHEVVTLQRDHIIKIQYPRFILTLLKRFIFKLLKNNKTPLFWEQKYNNDYDVVTQNTLGFVNKNIRIIELSDISHQLKEDDYDGFIVGSDQVWRSHYNNLNNTFLLFTQGWNIKRVSYAASFGLDQPDFSEGQIKKCKSGIHMFDGISVREKTGVDICKNIFNVDAELVLDPTLLLEKSDYERLLDNRVTPNGDLFVHILDKTAEKQALILQICVKKGWKPYMVDRLVDEHNVWEDINKRVQPPLENWLNGIANSKMVVTDSYHATVFSIIFNKPFIVIENSDRGNARFESLLGMFGLENRIVSVHDNFLDRFSDRIDYDTVNKILEVERKKSLNFLYRYF